MPFRHPLTVRYADTDAQGHVFFANYLTYFDEAMTGYLAAIGFGYADIQHMGIDLVYADARCKWAGSARFSDPLSISCAFVRLGDTSLTADYAVYIGDETEPVASGTCISVCIDAKTRQKVVVPDALRAAVAAFEGG